LTEALSPAVAIPESEARESYVVVAQRLLNLVLFVTVLTSSIVLVEPSPHDALMCLLLVMCVAAHVKFDRNLIPLLVLLIVWLVGGLLSLIQVGDEEKTAQYMGTSLYLAIAAVMFACLFSGGNLARLAILRRGYILAALIATVAGYVGAFHLLPGSELFLQDEGRVSGPFKDPNVYGPFLIYPLLLLIIGLITHGIRLASLVTALVLLGGLFLSFSRGAWAHFALSMAISTVLLLVVSPDGRMRARIALLSLIALTGASLLVVGLLSISSVRDMFLTRAQVFQSYDVGPGGRFGLQELALGAILDHPNGMGPYAFFRTFGEQQHNVYMQGFLVYGWLGGAAYLTLVAVTLMVGLRAALVTSPWQYYLIPAYAVFVGEIVEGVIVDTDHWRHFFLLLGLIWGLTAATIRFRNSRY
jgi:hypothetical protein